ncbi:hypothetical protein C8T65DRAFT_743357 [Cerioporus squamosus]|nr:hypothetical protein C8T65DRAFT_743357 [Cerioporus squamosus]
MATEKINDLNALHTEVTKFRSIPGLRTVGWALHSSPIQVSGAPLGYTEDWGLPVELDPNQIDKDTFLGNKIFIGDKYMEALSLRYYDLEHKDKFWYPVDSLLQAQGVVSPATINNPRHLDANGQQRLLVLKNGGATGTTFGYANGLESARRSYPEYGIDQADSLEIAVLSLDESDGPFSQARRYTSSRCSEAGDSGSIVVTRAGEILGMVTGGAGPPSDATDITWVTPFWWLQDQIKKQYPDASLYPVVETD